MEKEKNPAQTKAKPNPPIQPSPRPPRSTSPRTAHTSAQNATRGPRARLARSHPHASAQHSPPRPPCNPGPHSSLPTRARPADRCAAHAPETQPRARSRSSRRTRAPPLPARAQPSASSPSSRNARPRSPPGISPAFQTGRALPGSPAPSLNPRGHPPATTLSYAPPPQILERSRTEHRRAIALRRCSPATWPRHSPGQTSPPLRLGTRRLLGPALLDLEPCSRRICAGDHHRR